MEYSALAGPVIASKNCALSVSVSVQGQVQVSALASLELFGLFLA